MSLLSSRLKGPSQLGLEFAIYATDYLIYTRELPLILYPRDDVAQGQLQSEELKFDG